MHLTLRKKKNFKLRVKRINGPVTPYTIEDKERCCRDDLFRATSSRMWGPSKSSSVKLVNPWGPVIINDTCETLDKFEGQLWLTSHGKKVAVALRYIIIAINLDVSQTCAGGRNLRSNQMVWNLVTQSK